MAEKRNYRWRDGNFYARVSNEIANRVNAYQKKYDALQSDFQKRNASRKYTYEDAYVSDSADWANSVSKRRIELDAEADSISAYIDRFADGLDTAWVNRIKNSIADVKKAQGMIADAATKDHEWWSSFENEDAYQYAGRADGYSKKYDGMTYENIQAALDDLPDGEERQWLQYMQGDLFNDYVRGQSDYQQYVQKGAGMNYASFDPVEQGAIMERGNEYLGAIAALFNHFGTEKKYGGHLQSYVDLFQNLTEDEWNVLAYSVAKDRENGFYTDENGVAQLKEGSLVEQFLRSMEGSLEQSAGEKEAARYKDIPVIADLYAAKLGLSNFATGFNSFFNNNDTGYGSGTTQVAGSIIRESFADDGFNLPKWMGGASARQALFDLTSTTSQQIPTIAASSLLSAINPAFGTVVGTSLMGTSAAGNAYSEALDKGYGEKEARLYGSAVGTLEGTLQYLLGGISKLGGVSSKVATAVSGINSGLARFALQYGGQIASEGLEEGLQEIFDPLLQRAILDADADIDWSQVTYSALLGALSSGTLEIAPTVQSVKEQTRANNAFVSEYGGLAKDVIKNGTEGSKIGKIAEKYQKKLGKGKNITASQVRKVLESSAQERLTELGEDGNTAKIAKMAVKYASGQELTRAEKKELSHSKFGAQVSKEIRASSMLHNWMETAAETEYKSLESRMEDETPAKVSDTGKAIINGTDQEVDLTSPKIKKITKDSVILDVDGKDVDIDDIEFADDSQSYLYSAVSKIENITPGAATAIIRGYNSSSGQTVGEYLNGIDEAYTYGYHGYSEADLKAGNFATKLTDKQATDAYELGKYVKGVRGLNKADAIKQMRTAAQAEAEKATKEGKAAPGAKNLTITYNNKGTIVDFDTDKIGHKLTDDQKSAPALAKVFHKMGLGTNFQMYESYVKGNSRFYIDENGVERAAPSGVYRKSDGTILIDLNAYNGRGLTLDVMAHELTHFIQQWSDTKYKVLADFLVKTYEKTEMTMHQRVVHEQKRLEDIRGKKVSYDEAFDEVVANAMSKMLADGNIVQHLTELKAQDEKLAKKLWQKIKSLLNEFLNLVRSNDVLFSAAGDIQNLEAEFKQMQRMWEEAFVEASENYQASLTVSESQTLTEAGIGFDEDTKSVYSLHFSTAFKDEIQVGKKTFNTEAIAQVVAKGTGRSIEDARKWVQSELTIANIVMANPEFLDFEADNRYDAIKKNSDYPQGTVDLSNLCPKREEFTTMFDMLQKKYPNKLFTAQDVAEMRKILSDNDITVACGACFVEDRRQLLGEIADTYINMWKEAVETGKPLQKTNAAGVKSDLLVTKALAKQYGLTAGTKIMATDTYIPNQYDLTTYEGFKLLEKNHPTIAMGFNRYNNSRGQQSARLIEGRAEYKRQILGWSDAKVRSVNNNGGLRIFSFSDFEVVHLLDLVQVIIDCAAKGVKIQGYTKIPAFAKLVRDTGIKLNRSLIPRGDYGYHMENGKVVLDYDTTEGINIKDKNFIDESNNPNVGNIVIGINPIQIGAAMLDPFIDYIIPFHSNKAKEILKKLGTGEWVNYKESQHEKDISTGTSSKHNVNIYTEVINKYHPTNKVEFVEAFLKECKRQGKIPRYAEFLNVDENGDYAYREGYHKLLVDFKMFDADGNILPQGNITPKLNEGFMTELLNAEIDKKQNYEFPQKVYDDIDKKFGEQYSSQETDLDELSARDYNRLTTKKPIKVSGTELALVRAQRKARYGGMEEYEIPIIDLFRIGFDRTPNDAYSYYIRNSDADTFSFVMRKKIISDTNWMIREEKKYADGKGNETTDTSASPEGSSRGADKRSGGRTGDGRELSQNDQGIVDSKEPERDLDSWEGNPDRRSGIREQYSPHETDLDSNGKQLTKEQVEFFKDSKIRDKNGNLLVVRHGTSEDFHIFDFAKSGKNGKAEGYGFYFSDDTEITKRYGDIQKEVYLNITKPLYNNKRTIKKAELVKLTNALIDFNLEKYKSDGLVWQDSFISNYVYTYEFQMSRRYAVQKFVNEIWEYNTNDQDLVFEIAQADGKMYDSSSMKEFYDVMMKSIGYDGIIAEWPHADGTSNVYVTFDSEQSKYTSNTNPTSNPDMRYSEHDTDYSNRSLLANAFEGITKSSPEYKLIQEYKGRIRLLNEQEEKLSKLNAEIREIRFTEGKYDAKKLRELETEAKNVAQSINRQDKKLLSLEASEPLRKVLYRERKKEAQKTKAHVQEIQQNKKVRAEQTELRHKIRKTIRDLDKILNRGNKKQNVKEDLQPVVTKALQAAEILFTENYGNYDMLRNGIGANMSDAEEALVDSCAKMLKELDKMPTDGYENWQARQEAENRLNTKMSKLKEVFARERKRLNNTTVSSILGELADAYASLEKSEQSYVQGAYSEPVHNFLKNLQSEVGGTIVNDMTKDQLESLYAAYKMVLTTVRKANQMFNEELKQSREQLGNAVIEEVLKAGGVHLLGTKMGDAVSQFDWNNMKPIWVANRIGSDTFGKLMNGLFKGQYNFARDIDEVKKFKLKMDEKYKPRNWDAEKQYEFESSTGKKFSLKLQQIMSLYAFSKREQAYSHLLNGGFVFEENSTVVVDGKLGIKKTYIHKGAASYKLNEATLNGIINSLTAEQKAYVDEMQKYLSDVMGAKGNEVSMQLYGIQMFKEKFYFPLRSSGAYMERAKEAELKKQQGQINLVNSGFTHSVKPEAKNPIVLSGFMDVWAEHCNEMSMYHSMVLPMEDFRKVYNYSTIHDENMESASVYQTIQDAYGKAATNYIDQLYKELNAGATVDPRETPWKSLISKFKMSSVMLSLSVWVQQFSSIGRAYAVIDPKYFTGAKVDSHTKLVVADEMKKYAPVAIIKEMGGFDTGTKGNATAYIKAEKYGKDERIKGLVKDEQYRSDIMGYMPTKADEKTWCAIWEAVKRETKANHPKMDVKSDEFLKLAGERFSEVIEKTQVYDSVLARSANMRSKGNFMAMATAFMAEPTTTINLIEDAIRSGNKKYLARTFGSVAVSILLNNALASIVYALRDDDEDETFIEKYFQSFTSGLIDDFNPMSYYPFLKDIYSMLQGYDVERTDMAVFADVRDACKQVLKYLTEDTSEMDDDEIAKHNKNLWGAFGSCLDAVCSAFGVPLKNVRRDTLAIVNGIKTIGTDLSGERATTWNSFWDNVGAAVKDTIPIYALVAKDKAKTDKLYTAIISGDKSYLSRLKSTYKTDSAYQSAVVKALRKNDPRIKAAAQANVNGNAVERNRILNEIKAEGKFSSSYIIDAINAETSAIRNDAKPDKVAGQYEAYDFVEAVSAGDANTAKAVREDIISTYVANGKTQTEAENAFKTDVQSSVNEAYSYGTITKATAEKMLVEYADMDEEDATDKITYWDFCKTNPNCDLSESKVLDYLEFAEPAHVSLEVYEQFVAETKDLADIKDEWGDIEVTKREQVLEVIDSLPLSWQQKDALYLAYRYPESKIWDVPW